MTTPWPSDSDVAYATFEWVDWFNHRRLLEPVGHIPPAEKELPLSVYSSPSGSFHIGEDCGLIFTSFSGHQLLWKFNLVPGHRRFSLYWKVLFKIQP